MGVSIALPPLRLDVDQFVDFCHCGECKVVSYYDINLHLLMTNKFKHLFSCMVISVFIYGGSVIFHNRFAFHQRERFSSVWELFIFL